MSTKASNKKAAGHIKVQIDLPALPPTEFYAGIKKERGPKRKPLSEILQKVSHLKRVQNPYRSYTVNYKLRVFSYWYTASIPCGPTKKRDLAEMKQRTTSRHQLATLLDGKRKKKRESTELKQKSSGGRWEEGDSGSGRRCSENYFSSFGSDGL